MDPGTVLDYALFQLTPTRTRCDLVIFSGKKNEKLASGLLEPFLIHLQSAKDQISKGGYSITLRPSTSDASWFTKATLARFVKFVGTPEILERFVTIEREIDQIESSIELNEQANRTSQLRVDRNPSIPAVTYKTEIESNGSGDSEPEENPRVSLQRALESRKAILKKEQAMAYARALVSGFETDSIYDLVSFSDAFGAPRLRDACMNFIVLCNKKNDDKIWMDEVAAMQACSRLDFSYSQMPPGIILAGEKNNVVQNWISKTSGSGSITSHETLDADEDNMESNTMPSMKGIPQIPTWASHFPPNTQNIQAPVFQQIPPYPGHVFPGMPAHPNSMPWPSNFQDSSVYISESQRYTSFPKKKEKSRNHRLHHSTRHDESLRLCSDSDSSYEDEYINHKTSSRKNRAREEGQKTSSKLKDGLDVFEKKEEKKEGNWDMFQNLLLKDIDSTSNDTGSKTVHVREEYSMEKAYREESLDNLSKHASEKSNRSGFEARKIKFDGKEDLDGGVVKSSEEEGLLTSPRVEGQYYPQNAHIRTESETDHLCVAKDKKEIFVDDSFMVKSQLSDGTLENRPTADIIMASEIIGFNESKISMTEKLKETESNEVRMMIKRDSERVIESWIPEMDSGTENKQSENVINRCITEKGNSVNAANRNGNSTRISKATDRAVDGKGAKSKSGRSNSDLSSKSKIPPSGSRTIKSKAEKEEENRRRMEDLLMQRQKRIAERSASKGFTSETSPKSSSKETKTNNSVGKKIIEKPKASSSTDEDKKRSQKPVMRSSTIDRLASARTTTIKQLPNDSKVNQYRKTAPKGNSGTTTSSSMKRTTQEIIRQGQQKISPSDKRTGGINKSKGASSKVLDQNRKAAPKGNTGIRQGQNPLDKKTITKSKSSDTKVSSSTVAEGNVSNNNNVESFRTMKALVTVPKIERKEVNTLSPEVKDDEKPTQILSDKDSQTLGDPSTQIELRSKPTSQMNSKVEGNSTSTALKFDEENDKEKKHNPVPTKVLKVHFSTPPANNGTTQDMIDGRKKWSNGESSPKALKGFRRLIFFGRRI